VQEISLYIKRGKVSIRTSVTLGVAGMTSQWEWRHNENAGCHRRETREWRHNDNCWLMEIWQLASCGHGLQRS